MRHQLFDDPERTPRGRKPLRIIALCLLTGTLVFFVMSQAHAATRGQRKRQRRYAPRTEGMLLAIEASEYVIDLGDGTDFDPACAFGSFARSASNTLSPARPYAIVSPSAPRGSAR